MCLPQTEKSALLTVITRRLDLGREWTLTESQRRARIRCRTQLLRMSMSQALGDPASMEANRGELPRRCNRG